jgi:hypothetical protein
MADVFLSNKFNLTTSLPIGYSTNETMRFGLGVFRFSRDWSLTLLVVNFDPWANLFETDNYDNSTMLSAV